VTRVISTLVRRTRRLAALAAMPVYCRRYGLERIDPCYFVRPTIDARSIVLDCGLGNNADFSDAIIRRFHATCHGVDPTRKHQAPLGTVASRHADRLLLHPVALAGTTGWLTFYEPREYISGSLFEGHVNAGSATSYTVRSLSFEDLLAKIGATRIDLLKLDIEGAEYDVLAGISDETLKNIGQIIVEFHHYCVKGVTEADTRRVVDRITHLGFQTYSIDRINYLFFHV
jgi:FkbM family methyltransferase